MALKGSLLDRQCQVCPGPGVGGDVRAELGLALVGEEHRGEELDLLVAGLVDELGHAVEPVEVRDDLEGVALVDEELLPLRAVEHFLGVLGHKRIEEGIESSSFLLFARRKDRKSVG